MADRRASQKGRSEFTGRHVRLHEWLMKTEAWADLDPVARCVYVELARKYMGANNGRLSLSVRQLREALGISVNTAARALARLQDHGFIVVTEKGGFTRKVRHASSFRLTEFGCDVSGGLATKDFVHWKKNTVSLVTPTVSLVTPHCLSGDTRDHSKDPKTPPHGVTRETVSHVVGLSGDTHLSYQVGAASPAAYDSAASAPNESNRRQLQNEIAGGVQ